MCGGGGGGDRLESPVETYSIFVRFFCMCCCFCMVWGCGWGGHGLESPVKTHSIFGAFFCL